MTLRAERIWFRYDSKQPWLFADADLSVARGERLALLAPSGSGKTTLALLLAGYLQPQRGRILLDEKPLGRRDRLPVQLIHQHPTQVINPRWRMQQVLAESGGAYDESYLERLGIAPEWLERFPCELSGGELQRFCVARALLSGADYLICDEISTMLDVITQAQLWQVILQEAQARSLGLIVITHNEKLAERLATRTIDVQQLSSK